MEIRLPKCSWLVWNWREHEWDFRRFCPRFSELREILWKWGYVHDFFQKSLPKLELVGIALFPTVYFLSGLFNSDYYLNLLVNVDLPHNTILHNISKNRHNLRYWLWMQYQSFIRRLVVVFIMLNVSQRFLDRFQCARLLKSTVPTTASTRTVFLLLLGWNSSKSLLWIDGSTPATSPIAHK